MAKKKITHKVEELDIKDRISHLLEEARMVLPGTQALLGFQLIAFFNQGFKEIPDIFKLLHLISLIFIATASIFLMTPAAFHRIVERSKASDRLNKFGSRMVIMALGALLAGLTIDIFIVSFVVTQSVEMSLVIGGIIFATASLLWFSPLFYKKFL